MTSVTAEIEDLLDQIVKLFPSEAQIDHDLHPTDPRVVRELWTRHGLALGKLETANVPLNFERFLDVFLATLRSDCPPSCADAAVQNFDAMVTLLRSSLIPHLSTAMPKIEFYVLGAHRFHCLTTIFEHLGPYAYELLKEKIPQCVEKYKKMPIAEILDFLRVLVRTCYSQIPVEDLMLVFELINEGDGLKRDVRCLRILNEFLVIHEPRIPVVEVAQEVVSDGRMHVYADSAYFHELLDCESFLRARRVV